MALLRALRLVAKVHAFEVILAVIAALAVSALLGSLVVRLRGLGIPLDCWRLAQVETSLPAQCLRLVEHESLAAGEASLALAAAMAVPVFVGALLAAPTISQEIEQRAIYLSWALDPGRIRWAAVHLAVVLGLVVLLTAVVGLLGDLVESARRPYVAADATFDAFGQRGPIIVTRGLAAAGVGAFWSALTGRAIPGFVLGLASAAILIAASPLWFDRLGQLEAIPESAIREAAVIEFRYRDRGTGLVQTLAELRARSPHELDSQAYYDWLSQNFTPVPYGYPGRLYPEIVLRQALIEAGVAVVGVAGAALVLRRRPMP
ncbi:MAG TPA: hypothetical protein VNO86_07755 [Candidatus Binatia bacterium]|nr:hypothetical protein [Candidatus Binatia bacterium]